LNTLLKKEN